MRVLATATIVWLLPALAGSDSLGGAARKEAQRREKARPAETRVFGEADLAARSDTPLDASAAERPGASAEPQPSSPERPEAVAPGTAAASEDQVRRDLEREEQARREKEAYWRRAAANARSRVAQAQQEYDYVCTGGTRLTGG